MSNVPNRQHAVNNEPPIGRRTPAGDAFSELVATLFRLNGVLASSGEALTRPTRQTTARWQLLAILEDGPMAVAQIARTLGLARQSVQRVADSMESTGLVRYDANPRHRRAKLVSLTDQGRAVLSSIQAAQRPWADAIGAAVGERELRRASALLERVLGVLAVRLPALEAGMEPPAPLSSRPGGDAP